MAPIPRGIMLWYLRAHRLKIFITGAAFLL
jgi:hypothetical protein